MLSNYDIPLRILECIIETCVSSHYCGGARSVNYLWFWLKHTKTLREAKQLLTDHGGRSLHLFLAKGLPGYAKEDMEEVAKLSA